MIFVTPPIRSASTGKIICEGYRRNVISRGGREVFISANLPAHLSMVHLFRTGRLLKFLPPNEDGVPAKNTAPGAAKNKARPLGPKKAPTSKMPGE